jgi:hypothetical protein
MAPTKTPSMPTVTDLTWKVYIAIPTPARPDDFWKLSLSARKAYIESCVATRLAAVRVMISEGRPLGRDLLLTAVMSQEVSLTYYLLARGVSVSDSIPTTEYDEQEFQDEEEEDAWREIYQLGGRTALELASNASGAGEEASSDAWVLTKLLLLAGGEGNPFQHAGYCPCDQAFYSGERWTRFLIPLFNAGCEMLEGSRCPTTTAGRRAWWLSDAGALLRWKANGGELACLLERLATATADEDGQAAAPRRSSRVAKGDPFDTIKRVAQLPAGECRMTPAFPYTFTLTQGIIRSAAATGRAVRPPHAHRCDHESLPDPCMRRRVGRGCLPSY